MQGAERWRRTLFAHVNGLVTLPLASALARQGVLADILSRGEATLEELIGRHGGNGPDATMAPACDATHGLSDQYILELPVFEQVVREVGLRPDLAERRLFPDSALATISLHFLRTERRRHVR